MNAPEDVQAAVEAWLLELAVQGYAYTTAQDVQRVPAEQYVPDGAP